MTWNKITLEQFNQILGKIPIFLREIAQKKVSLKAENLAKANNRVEVIEKDLVDAFFAETPFGFHGPLKNDMKEFGIDYTKYNYDK